MQARPPMDAGTRSTEVRGDPTVWTGLASCAGALTTVALLPTLIAALVTTLLLWKRGARWLVVGVLLALGVGAARAHLEVTRYEATRDAVISSGAWPARCSLSGTVSRSPVMLGGGLRIEVDARGVRCRDGPSLAGRITLHLPRDAEDEAPVVARGDVIDAMGSLAPPYRFWNDGSGDPRPGSARRGIVLSGGAEDLVVVQRGSSITTVIDRARSRIRERIIVTFPEETAAMARALVLGEDDLPERDQRAFRKSGLAHLLAVSGMHLVLVVMGFVSVLRALLVRISAVAIRVDAMRVAAGAGVPVAWAYADLAGGSGSAIRAAWMCTFALLARALARRTAAPRALGLSILAMSISDALVVFDLSFVLSALATAGLIVLARPIEAALTKHLRLGARSLPAFVTKPLAATAAATIACAPVLATMAPELSLGGLIANVVAVPLGEAAALPLCLVHALLAGWPAAESGSAVAASGALVLVRAVAHAFTWGSFPVPPPTNAELGALATAAAGAACGRARRWAGAGAIAIVLLEIVARVRGAPHGVLRVTFIDVGQGDSALVDLPDGSAMLVDGGGLVGSPIDVGERAVAPLLAARRRKSLAAAVLTHPHPDHYLGFGSVLPGVELGAFWDNGQGEAEGVGGAYADLLRQLRGRGIDVLSPRELCGARTIGGAIVEVLAPCPRAADDRGPNDNSFVLRIRFGERAILMTGDAEREEEEELLASDRADNGERGLFVDGRDVRTDGRLRADVLKVGHHGSRTSTAPSFLEAVAPRVAVISCGVRNRFGHPHPSTLETLEQSGARVYRTDRDGSVIVTTDGRSLDVRTMAER